VPGALIVVRITIYIHETAVDNLGFAPQHCLTS
jgi:hypothetical protein